MVHTGAITIFGDTPQVAIGRLDLRIYQPCAGLVYPWYTVGMEVGMRHRELVYEIP